MSDRSTEILAALGGRPNIVQVEACITRLRVRVRDTSAVDDSALREVGAHGVIRAGGQVQVVLGPESRAVAEGIEALL
jgi:N-acetylglucosamine PTS system EIIB component